MLHLGVNVDHVATLRQARRATYPDPVFAALIDEQVQLFLALGGGWEVEEPTSAQ